MKRHAISFSDQYQVFSTQSYFGYAPNQFSLPVFLRNCLVQNLSSLGSTISRPFPDYSPKKPTIKDSELVHHIYNTINQRRTESLRCILKPCESKFRPDHLIWVLMNSKSDYKLVLDFFECECLHKEPSLEARCIVIQLAVAAKDPVTAQRLIRDFWVKPKLGTSNSFGHFIQRLIYTYKDWGSTRCVFDIFFQVLVGVGMLDEARELFDKMLNINVVISVDSSNLLRSCLPKDFNRHQKALKIFSEFLEVGVFWNPVPHNIVMHSLCQLGKVKEAHNLLMQMELKGFMPDVISYSTIINGYCYAGGLQTVMKLIEEMQMKDLKPNQFTCTTWFIQLSLMVSARSETFQPHTIFFMKCRTVKFFPTW